MPAPAIYDLPQLYDRLVPAGPCEAFYCDAARRAGGPVLELACGTGRLTIPIARAGIEIVGVDLSPAMLARARSKARSAGASHASFVTGDMRRFALGRRFNLAIVSCNSLAHLTTREDFDGCLAGIRRHLVPGGMLAFDVVNPDIDLLARRERRFLPIGPQPDGVAVEERAEYDAIRQVRTAWWRVGGTTGEPRDLASLALRQFFPRELPLLLEAAGFALTERFGDFEGGPLTAESPNQVCRAALRAG